MFSLTAICFLSANLSHVASCSNFEMNENLKTQTSRLVMHAMRAMSEKRHEAIQENLLKRRKWLRAQLTPVLSSNIIQNAGTKRIKHDTELENSLIGE
jgi:hypothetical protein